MSEGIVHVDFKLASKPNLDRKIIRKTLGEVGRKTQATARALVSKEQTSKAGEYPGYRSGRLSRSIGYKLPTATKRRPGLMVIVMPNVKGGRNMEKLTGPYYPAFLRYGVRRGAKRGKSHKAGASGGSSWRIAPRDNFMTDALKRESPWVRQQIAKALVKSIKVEKV